jgi:amino-acid N-acetyltransferase
LSELYDHLRDFYVAQDDKAGEGLVGVCSLNISWEDIGEIRSLAVVEGSREKGIGSRLVQACLSEATELGLSKVFVLTLIDGYFARFGFKEVEKSSLPHKIWADCIRCPKFPDHCDETAMVLTS